MKTSYEKRPVALLDVDHTLLIGNELNTELIEALKANGIKDVYLFTDMTFKQDSLEERNRLIENLSTNGFIVHGVITPNDLAWDNIHPEQATQLYTWCMDDDTFTGELCGEAFEEFVISKEAVIPNLANAIQTYQPDKAGLGRGFQEAAQELNETKYLSNKIWVRSKIAKLLADHLAEKYQYVHNKGLLLDLFLHHKPEWAGIIVIADDNEKVIESIENFVPVDEGTVIPPVIMIPVPLNERQNQEYYQQIIQDHTAQTIHDFLDNIQEYPSEEQAKFINLYLPFFSSEQGFQLVKNNEISITLDSIQSMFALEIDLENDHYLEQLKITSRKIEKGLRTSNRSLDEYAYFLEKTSDALSDWIENCPQKTNDEAEAICNTLRDTLPELQLMLRICNMHGWSLLTALKENNTPKIITAIEVAQNADRSSDTKHTDYKHALVNLFKRENKLYVLAEADKKKELKLTTLTPRDCDGSRLFLHNLETQLNPDQRNQLNIMVPREGIEDQSSRENLRFLSNFYHKTFIPKVIDVYNTLDQKMPLSPFDFEAIWGQEKPFHPAVYAQLKKDQFFENCSDDFINKFSNLEGEVLSEHQISLCVMLLNQEDVSYWLGGFEVEHQRLALKLLELSPYLDLAFKQSLATHFETKGFEKMTQIINANREASQFLLDLRSTLNTLSHSKEEDGGSAPALTYLLENEKHVLDHQDEPLPTFVYAYIRQSTGKEKALLMHSICSKLEKANHHTPHDYMLLAAILDEAVKHTHHVNESLYEKIISKMISNGPTGTTEKVTTAIHELALYLSHTERRSYLEAIINDQVIRHRIQYKGKGINFLQASRTTPGYSKLCTLLDISKEEMYREGTDLATQKSKNYQETDFHKALMTLEDNLLIPNNYLILQMLEDDVHRKISSNDTPTLVGCAIQGHLFEDGAWENTFPELRNFLESLSIPPTPIKEPVEENENGFTFY